MTPKEELMARVANRLHRVYGLSEDEAIRQVNAHQKWIVPELSLHENAHKVIRAENRAAISEGVNRHAGGGRKPKRANFRVMAYDGDFKTWDRVGEPSIHSHNYQTAFFTKEDAEKALGEWMSLHPPSRVYGERRNAFALVEEVGRYGTYTVARYNEVGGKWNRER